MSNNQGEVSLCIESGVNKAKHETATFLDAVGNDIIRNLQESKIPSSPLLFASVLIAPEVAGATLIAAGTLAAGVTTIKASELAIKGAVDGCQDAINQKHMHDLATTLANDTQLSDSQKLAILQYSAQLKAEPQLQPQK